jgi:class 3 adenylate cyclase/tetratricopeptide (TPR) repeat protein
MTDLQGGTSLARAPSFRLGGLEVRPPTREVIGAGGAALLEPRIMQVLVALAGRRGEVVSRSELIDLCWAGRVVGDDAINRCIQAIRRLADSDGGFSIRTVARVGYRLEEANGAAAGEAIANAPLERVSLSETPIPQASERRHLTILSCGLARPVGAVLDPEHWYVIAAEWRKAAIAAALRFGAHVDITRGDRLLACFGYPEAQEDAADRAVRAGLEIVDQMGPLNARFGEEYGVGLSVRIGIHAGVTLVAHSPETGVELFGEALDLAARIAAQAEAGSVTTSDAVVERLAGRFIVEAQGRVAGESGAPALTLYRVRSAGLPGERRRRREQSCFVGREDEIAILSARWERVCRGAGQLVLAHGEPGIGKSRLVEAFQERIAPNPHLWIECRGEPLFANTALHAAAQMLRQGLGWRALAGEQQISEALEAALERGGLKLSEAFPLIAEMLNLPVPDSYPPLMLAPEQRRRRLLSTLADWLFSATREQPLVLVIEDLHWLDPSSLELLHRLAEQGAGMRLMLLCTARPEFRAAWPVRSHHIQIALGGLGQSEMRELVGGLAAEESLDPVVVDEIVDRADGIPLFAEALARLAGEPTGAGHIPANLMDSLAARLDRLGEAKLIAQIGAVIGRSFSWPLLRALAGLSEEALQAALDRLVEAGLISAHGTAPDLRYRFRHALIRDAAHGMLLTAQRRDWHGHVAKAIAEGVVDAAPEELAHHWTQAGVSDEAVGAWARAGQLAYSRHAFAEAANAYRQALAVLATQPDTPARDARELDLCASLSLALVPTENAQSAAIAAIAERSQLLAKRSGDLGVLITTRTIAFLAASFRSEWSQAAQLADQVADLARHADAGVRPETLAYGRAMGHSCHANAYFYRGDLGQAERHFRAWEDLNRERSYSEQGVIVLSYANGEMLAWHLGEFDETERRIASAWDHARRVDNPFEICACLVVEGLVAIHLRDAAEVERLGEEAMALAHEHGFAQFESWAATSLGWARAQRGAPADGVALIRAALPQMAKIESRVSLPWFLTMLGEAQALDGDVAGAFESFDQALNICPEERLYRPHSLIARGTLAAKIGDIAGAKASFREAIATAEMMGAIACKQRASAALARLRATDDPRITLG